MADYTTSLDSGVKSAQDAARAADAARIAAQAAGSGGGVTDHGLLTGLADDDHPQYAKADGTRGSFATTAQGTLAATASQPGHTHSGADIASGTVGTARLGSGTASSTTFLRGDQTWATPAGGSALNLVPKVGKFLLPHSIAGGIQVGTSAYASGNQPGCPYVVTKAITVSTMTCRITTTEAGVNAKLLLYSSDSDGYPATLIATSATFSVASGAIINSAITPVALTPGMYWGFIRTDGGTTHRFYECNITGLPGITDSTGAMNNNGTIAASPGTYASPAATISTWSYVQQVNVPLIALERSA